MYSTMLIKNIKRKG